jgi:hypothetical protein
VQSPHDHAVPLALLARRAVVIAVSPCVCRSVTACCFRWHKETSTEQAEDFAVAYSHGLFVYVVASGFPAIKPGVSSYLAGRGITLPVAIDQFEG